MHGRKKNSESRSEAELTALRVKAESLAKTTRDVLRMKKEKIFTSISLELTGKILRSNPDFYSVWNYRKEILMSLSSDLSSSSSSEHCHHDNALRDQELKLSEDCIKRNPKSCMLRFKQLQFFTILSPKTACVFSFLKIFRWSVAS